MLTIKDRLGSTTGSVRRDSSMKQFVIDEKTSQITRGGFKTTFDRRTGFPTHSYLAGMSRMTDGLKTPPTSFETASIDELRQDSPEIAIQMRCPNGERLRTLCFTNSLESERPPRIRRVFEADADLIAERLAKPISDGLMTSELIRRLEQLGHDT